MRQSQFCGLRGKPKARPQLSFTFDSKEECAERVNSTLNNLIASHRAKKLYSAKILSLRGYKSSLGELHCRSWIRCKNREDSPRAESRARFALPDAREESRRPGRANKALGETAQYPPRSGGQQMQGNVVSWRQFSFIFNLAHYLASLKEIFSL